MRLKGVHVPARSTAGRAFARRARWWQLIPASAVAAALGAAVTVAAQGATATGGEAAGAQPVGSASRAPAALGTGVVDPAVKPYLDPKQLSAVPVGPGDVSKPVRMVLTSAGVTTALDDSGIPEVALEAYRRAAAALAASDAACHLPWQLVAAIGRVESDDGRFGGAMLLPDGYGTRPIYGIPLDGRAGVALVRDTDGGRLDGDPGFDRAVGPMQFIPSTWAVDGVDGNGDGKKDPNNIFDATLAAADYLCAGGGDMANRAQEAAAVLRYNDADEYVRVVLALAASYEHGDFATVPTAGPVGTGGNGGGSTPGTPSSPRAEAPAPTKAPVQSASQAPAQTPTPQPTAPSSPATAADPTVNPTETPTEGPSGEPATTAPATPAPTDTTETGPTPSGQPSQAPVPSATPPFHAGQTANIGWAPAMRQVVVKLLAAPKAAPAQPVGPAHPGPRPAGASTHPARKTTAPNHGWPPRSFAASRRASPSLAPVREDEGGVTRTRGPPRPAVSSGYRHNHD
jgi:membrane-bound lytic murein transglycosylase B